MSVCWTPMCEVLVSKMFVCAMPYVLVPVVLQWDVIVLDDCVPDVFVMDSFRGCQFCMSVCIMYVCRIYILDVCEIDDCVVVVGVRYLCVFNAQIWNVCLRSVSVCDQCQKVQKSWRHTNRSKPFSIRRFRTEASSAKDPRHSADRHFKFGN